VRRRRMSLTEFAAQFLDEKEALLIEMEPAFTFSYGERGESDE
jgi:hypothetical protein